MARALRWFGYAVGALLVLLLLAAALLWFASNRKLNAEVSPRSERLVQPTPAAMADIGRRARTLGCISCHGEGLSGKAFLDDAKVARLHATNLTEVATRANDQQIARAIRQGIGSDGRSLLVMPSEAYQYLTDEETSALIAYIRRLPRSGEPSPPRRLGPLARLGIAKGSFRTAPVMVADYRQQTAPALGPDTDAGRHLALTTCSGCHGGDLAGRQVSPEMTSPDLTIAGAYDLPAFTRLMRDGVAPGGKHLKTMRDVARNDSRFYTDEEIAALHAYLVARAQR
jgi:mono/diheme cytochrome c family protein